MDAFKRIALESLSRATSPHQVMSELQIWLKDKFSETDSPRTHRSYTHLVSETEGFRAHRKAEEPSPHLVTFHPSFSIENFRLVFITVFLSISFLLLKYSNRFLFRKFLEFKLSNPF